MDHDGSDEDHDEWDEEALDDEDDAHGDENLDEKMADEQDVLDGVVVDLDDV